MNFKCYNDGTYKTWLGKNKCDADFYLIDISTDRKGSLYTITKNIESNIVSKDISVIMDTSYSSIDVPCDDFTLLSSRFSVDTVERFYSIYPLIKQMFAFNTFCEIWGLALDSCISIESIIIEYGDIKATINECDNDRDIEKTFKRINMNTSVSKILPDNSVLIMKDGIWEIIECDDNDNYPHFNKFDYIGIPLPNTESLYLLSYKEYNIFRKKMTVQINMLYSDYEDPDRDYDDYCANWISLDNMRDILYGCLFTPQLILLEQKIYDIPMFLEIVISTKYVNMKLSISENEILVPKNTCIFEIIKRLLEFEL